MTVLPSSLRTLYPFTSRWANVDGHRYHYIDEGAGEPIVCVHGNPTWSFFYRNVVSQLRGEFRVLAVDHIGCGLSDKPSADAYEYTLKTRIDDLVSVLDELKLTRNVTLVLHDWGGIIGVGAALRRPERIKRIVLMNTAAFFLPERKMLPLPLWLIRNVSPIASVLVQGMNLFSIGANVLASARGLSPEVSRAYRTPYDSWANRIAVKRFVQDIPRKVGDPSHAEVAWISENLDLLADIPKLVCWGEQDFVFDADFLAEWRRRCPEAEFHTFPSAGHYCLEDDGDQIIPLIGDFLHRHPVHALAPDLEACAR
ncbi:MAG: alpha/beta fold hydrolase [Planctomycetes bacterium]|nr:alpha/beta fold hydrolase [Planctomycetota bacterium]